MILVLIRFLNVGVGLVGLLIGSNLVLLIGRITLVKNITSVLLDTLSRLAESGGVFIVHVI
jgi:hypothetical protein